MIRLASLCALGALTWGGCAATAFSNRPVNGLPPTHYSFTNTAAAEVTTANALGDKHGKACSQSVLGLVTWGDSSVPGAAREAGIHTIAAVDDSFLQFLGLWARYCVIVSGQ